MITIEDTSREEKIEMYSKLNKKELVELIINANDLIDRLTKGYVFHPTIRKESDEIIEYPYTGFPYYPDELFYISLDNRTEDVIHD